MDSGKTGKPTPTVRSAVDGEIEAANAEAVRMCDVGTSRGLCCDEVTITLVAADTDGNKWMGIYYGANTTHTIPGKKCDKDCEARGGVWQVPVTKKAM